jgi:hypothetical protein
MITNKIYPEIDVHISVDTQKNSGKIRLDSWVLVKRKGQYYEVHCFNAEVFNVSSIAGIQEISNSISRFHDLCLRIQYLWVLPDKLNLKRDIKEGRVKKSINTLNFKERFLFKTRIL